MTKKEFAPVTPGEMRKEEFLTEYGLSQNQLTKAIGILHRKTSCSLYPQ
jgi:plasmid maintenance system antidote protein VapI